MLRPRHVPDASAAAHPGRTPLASRRTRGCRRTTASGRQAPTGPPRCHRHRWRAPSRRGRTARPGSGRGRTARSCVRRARAGPGPAAAGWRPSRRRATPRFAATMCRVRLRQPRRTRRQTGLRGPTVRPPRRPAPVPADRLRPGRPPWRPSSWCIPTSGSASVPGARPARDRPTSSHKSRRTGLRRPCRGGPRHRSSPEGGSVSPRSR